MRRALLLIPFMLWALPAFGHPSQGYDTIPNCTIANLNQCGGEKLGNRAWVVDGKSDADCTVGGGALGRDAFQHACLKTQFGWRAEKPTCTLDNLADCKDQVPSGGEIVPQNWQSWIFEPRRFTDIWDTTNDWVLTQVGTCAAPTLKTAGYAFMRLSTSALDNDACEYTHDGANGIGAVLFQGTRDYYFEILFRLRQTVNTVDTFDEAEFFFGLSILGTHSVLTSGASDFIGFRKLDQNDDATNNLWFVSGNVGSSLIGEFKQATGWTSTGAGIGDGNVDANRAAKLIGPGNWTLLQFYAHDLDNVINLSGSGEGLVNVFVDGVEIAGSPFHIVDNMPNATRMTNIIAFKNGDASSKILDIARLVVARKMTVKEGSLSRYTND